LSSEDGKGRAGNSGCGQRREEKRTSNVHAVFEVKSCAAPPASRLAPL
jgi:hypothetical protein